jgi:hypothetical protein
MFDCTLLQLANYNSFEGVLYCRPHFDQHFKRTGSLDKSFEGMIHPFVSLICPCHSEIRASRDLTISMPLPAMVQELQRLSSQKEMLRMRYVQQVGY